VSISKITARGIEALRKQAIREQVSLFTDGLLAQGFDSPRCDLGYGHSALSGSNDISMFRVKSNDMNIK